MNYVLYILINRKASWISFFGKPELLQEKGGVCVCVGWPWSGDAFIRERSVLYKIKMEIKTFICVLFIDSVR